MDFAALQHSVFLQALGSAILNSVWQSFIIWFLYESILFFFKNASSRLKHNIGFILLSTSFIWFIGGFISKILSYGSFDSLSSAHEASYETMINHSNSALNELFYYVSSSLSYLSVAYIFLLFFLLLKFFTAYRNIYIISHKGLVRPPQDILSFSSILKAQMGISKKVKIWISKNIDVPATIGFIKPVILIPLASLNHLSSYQLEAIILHELSHIKRNDYLTNLIISIIETILFFNPFVVLLADVIKRERENCCDDYVLEYQYDPHSYATALFRLEQTRHKSTKLAIGAVSGKKQLLSRIQRITDRQIVPRQFNYGQKLLALLCVTAIFCSLAWLSPENKKQPLNAKEIISEPGNVRINKNESVNTQGSDNEPKKENLQTSILKYVFSKIGNEVLKGTGNITIENKQTIKSQNRNKEERLPAPTQENLLPQAIFEGKPVFTFDKNGLTFPSSINIQNIPFQNMNFNIDLSKIDLKKLNKSLKRAYGAINSVDWKVIQSDINKSISQINVNGSPLKNQFQFYADENNSPAKIKEVQQKLNLYVPEEQIRHDIMISNSILQKKLVLLLENNKEIQQVYKTIQLRNQEMQKNNAHYKYEINFKETD